MGRQSATATDQAIADGDRRTSEREAPRGSETILLVEDSEQVRNLAHAILKRQSYAVREASCGKDALKLLAAHLDHIRLLLTDVVMPEMNGRELYLRASEMVPSLRVTYTSTRLRPIDRPRSKLWATKTGMDLGHR